MTFTGRKGTALLVALIVSVCLNLLLAGVMVGGRWHHGGPWWRDVPEEARPIMKQAFDAHKAEFDSQRDAVQQARQKVADILKVDPIDQAALDQALADLSQKSQAIRELGNTMMVEVAKQLPPEIRAQMADRWAKERFRRRPEGN
jgi:Spy/CpxP family protein refolding chaperone